MMISDGFEKKEFEQRFKNILRNGYFPLFFLAFIAANMQVIFTKEAFATIILSELAALALASHYESIWQKIKEASWPVKLFSLLTAYGICEVTIERLSERLAKLLYFIPIANSDLLAYVLAIPAVFILLVLFFDGFAPVMRGVLEDISIKECLALIGIFEILLIYSGILFSQSTAFYAAGKYDFIYTSDSGMLVNGANCYLNLFHPENDLRQPLFAVFAMPLMGAVCAIAKVFSHNQFLYFYIMNSGQIFILIIANYMLAKLVTKNKTKRILFFILVSCSYTTLLYSVMMEQYIIGYFWLIYFIYRLIQEEKVDYLAFTGMGGTLLTNLVWTPFLTSSGLSENMGQSIKNAFKGIFTFSFFMLLFMRFDEILRVVQKINHYTKWSKGVAYEEKIMQFTAFVRNCFLSPNAGEVNTTWKLMPVTDISLIGCGIILLAMIGFFLSRDDHLSKIAFGWLGFSYLLLVQIGWGSVENGMILYSLYFGWAYFALSFKALDFTWNTIQTKKVLGIVIIILGVAMLKINYTGMADMLRALATHYPAVF